MANEIIDQKKWYRVFRGVYIVIAIATLIWCVSLWTQVDRNQKANSILSDYVIHCDNGKNINAGAVGLYSKTTTDLTYDEDMKARKLCRGNDASLNFIIMQRSNGIDDNTLLQNLTKRFYNNEKPMYEYMREKHEDPFTLVNTLINEAIQGIEAPAKRNYVLKRDLLSKSNIKKLAKKWGGIIFATLLVGGFLFLIFEIIKKLFTKIYSREKKQGIGNMN